MLLGKNFDDIDDQTIQSLIDGGATESVHLEFKRESYGNADSDKKELLKDISSFSNTLGGHLIIGMVEEDGAASAPKPLPAQDVDGELLRLENIVRTGVEPTIVGLRMKRVDVNGGSLIVISIPRSFNPPHRVIYKNSNRYYSRNSAGAHELTLEELRLLFGQQRSIEERARAFVSERLLRIQSGDGAMPIPVSRGVMVMHLVPLPDFGTDRQIEISEMLAHKQYFRPLAASISSWRINLEGYCNFRPGVVCEGYAQVFRNGAIEATSTSLFPDGGQGRHFPSEAAPRNLIKSLNDYMCGLRVLQTTPPVLLQISAVGVNGVRISTDHFNYSEDPEPYDREVMRLPPSIIIQYRDDGNYETTIATQMNFLWNAFGLERCTYFDQDGKWVDRQ